MSQIIPNIFCFTVGDESAILMVRTMAYSVREKICRMLNVRRQLLGGDFKTLAGLVEMSNEDIKLISDKDNPAEEVLSWWETQNSATMEAFQLKLQEMERHDIVEVLEKGTNILLPFRFCCVPVSRYQFKQKQIT